MKKGPGHLTLPNQPSQLLRSLLHFIQGEQKSIDPITQVYEGAGIVVLPFLKRLTEHSFNKIITNFENEFRPGVLSSSVQQALPCKNSKQQGHR